MNDFFNPLVDRTIKDGRLSQAYRQRVVDKAPVDATVTGAFLSSALPRKRVQWLGAAMVVGCGLLLGRLFWLQVVLGQTYRNAAEANRIEISAVPAARGVIYDVTGEALLRNEPNFVATIVPNALTDDNALSTIATALGLDVTALTTLVNEHAEKYYSQPLVVREFIPHAEALDLMTELQAVSGVRIEAQAARHYLQPELYAPIIGYLGRISPDDLDDALADDYDLSDHIGKTGLELTYEHSLRGHKGSISKEVTATGAALNVIAEEQAVPGNNLVLSVDHRLQELLYDAIKQTVDSRGLPGGAAVALDPRTGAVRALVSYPSYDPNAFIQGIDQASYQALLNDARKPLFNKAISGEYPSGSTFKLVVAAAALQEGVVTPSTTVNSTGGIQVDSLFPDWKAGGHGVTNIYKALAESVNTYFYLAGGGSYNADTREISGGLGIDRIGQYAQAFGLGSSSGIALPGEADGFVPTRQWKEAATGEPWYLGDTYHVSIGQGDLLVTPLQVAQYTAVVANGGTLYQPQLVDRFTNQQGDSVDEVEPVVLGSSIVAPEYLRVVRQGMRDAVLTGSARSMNSSAVATAGKTGTAQIGGTEATHSWYTTFLPYDDPQLVLTVLVEEGGEGTEAALPIAKQVLSQYTLP